MLRIFKPVNRAYQSGDQKMNELVIFGKDKNGHKISIEYCQRTNEIAIVLDTPKEERGKKSKIRSHSTK